MRVPVFASAALAALLCMPARAETETPYETVAGYEVTRVEKPGDPYPCRAVRAWNDPADGNAGNALAFGEMKDVLLVSVVYERWKWQAGKLYKAALSVDDGLIDANAQWLGNGSNLALKVSDAQLPKFDAGRKLILGFRDGNADFDLTGFKPAFAALRRCNRGEKPASARAAAVPVPAPAPVPSEDRAVAYLFGLYDRWAFDACDVATSAKQRQALDARMGKLKPEMSAIEPDLIRALPSDPGHCPPSAVLQKQMQLLLDNEPEAFVARMDERPRGEFQGIVRPILARLRPPAPVAAAGGGPAPLPSDARIGAYTLGALLQDAVARCDLPTTTRQRTALDTRLAGLKPEMGEVEPAIRALIKDNPCPEGKARADMERQLPELLAAFGDRSPEDAVDVAKRLGLDPLPGVRRITAALRPTAPSPPAPTLPPPPSTPSEARMAAYLWGLVLRDKLAQCDLATTTRQRAGLDARLASLQPEMAPFEAALREQIRGKLGGCPAEGKAAELVSTVTLFAEQSPEAFAAQMDKQTASGREGGAKAQP